jgi:hypothetical protein
VRHIVRRRCGGFRAAALRRLQMHTMRISHDAAIIVDLTFPMAAVVCAGAPGMY